MCYSEIFCQIPLRNYDLGIFYIFVMLMKVFISDVNNFLFCYSLHISKIFASPFPKSGSAPISSIGLTFSDFPIEMVIKRGEDH